MEFDCPRARIYVAALKNPYKKNQFYVASRSGNRSFRIEDMWTGTDIGERRRGGLVFLKTIGRWPAVPSSPVTKWIVNVGELVSFEESAMIFLSIVKLLLVFFLLSSRYLFFFHQPDTTSRLCDNFAWNLGRVIAWEFFLSSMNWVLKTIRQSILV